MFNASLMNQSVCDRATSSSQSQAADFVFCSVIGQISPAMTSVVQPGGN